MADEIRQELGFDAKQALETLARLNKAFDSFGTRIDELTAKLRAFNNGSSATEAATAKLASAFNSNMGASAEAAERLTTSVGLLSRIVFTQFVIQQLRVLKTEFVDAAQDAAKFQTKVAEISTIADGASFGQIATQVRAISDNLNIPLLEAAGGAYQALSNNVGDFNQSLKLTESAGRFAKATNSTLTQSVDLLSAAINSYHFTADDANKVAGVFFETIRAGRITAAELSNTFGRVGERAAALGISFEEVNAALATTTTSGIKSSEAITLLNGVITGLTKPTDEMSAALAKFGFSSAEAAVATLGLPKLLQSLADSTDGTAASLAKLFPNIRGVNGELSLTGANLGQFARNLDSARNAGAAFANEKFLQATATDASKVTTELNKLHNVLTVDFGQSLLHAAADASQFVGGVDNAVEAVKVMSPFVLSASVALAGYAVSARVAATASALLEARLGPLGAALIAIGAANTAANAVDRTFFSVATDGLEKLDDAAKKSLDNFKQIESDKVQAFDRANEERVRLALQNVASLNRIYLQDRENLRASNDALVDNTKKSADNIVRIRERMVEALAKSADDARKTVGDSQLRVSDFQAGRNEGAFNQSIGRLSEAEQVFALTRRSSQEATQASKALLQAAQAGDQQGLQRALSLFQTAQATNERAAEIANRTGSQNQQFEVAHQLQQLDAQRLESEKRLQNLQQKRIAALDAERAKQQGIIEQIRAATKVLTDNTSQFDKSGNLLPEGELSKRKDARQKTLGDIVKLSLNDKDLTAEKALGLADFVSRFQNELTNDPLRLKVTVEGESERIKAQLTQSFDKFSVKLGFDITGLESALGKKFSSPNEVSQGLVDARKRAAEIEKQISDSATAKQSTGALRTEVDVIGQVIDDLDEKLRGDRTNVGKTFREFAADFRVVSQQAKITDDDVKRLFGELDRTREASNGFFGIGKVVLGNLPEIVQILPKLKELQQQRNNVKAIEVTPGTLEELNRLKAVINSIDPVTPFKSAALEISSGATAAERIANSFERAALAAQGLTFVQPSISTQAPRGVDSVTQQLGSTSTVNLGGITVNAAPGADGQAIGREVAAALNRELRRGTVQLRV
jgi:TP901 family phage tail tape measure protein